MSAEPCDVGKLALHATFLRDRSWFVVADAPLQRLAGMVTALVLLHCHAPDGEAFRATFREAVEYARGLDLAPWSANKHRRKRELALDILSGLEALAAERGLEVGR
jgi:hypothetical protein